MGKKKKAPVRQEDLKQLLQSPDEEILGVLGTSYLQNLVKGSGLSRSVMIATDKRLYMRGALISQGHFGQQDVVVLLEDVSGLRTISNDPKWAKKWACLFGLLAMWSFIELSGGKLGKKDDEMFTVFAWLGSILGLLFGRIAWFGKSRTFAVEYSGTSVSVPAKWYSLEEIETFRKAVTAGIESLRESQRHAPATPAATPSPAPAAVANTGTTSIADELKKLADLRDAGILTDEEFQTQKQRLLS